MDKSLLIPLEFGRAQQHRQLVQARPSVQTSVPNPFTINYIDKNKVNNLHFRV